jgi:hypothetical protein
MRKRIRVSGLFLVSATALGVFALAGAWQSQPVTGGLPKELIQAPRYANAAADWVVSNGDSTQLSATDITGGVEIGSLHAYSAEMRKSSKVTLDGLSFTFQNTGSCDNGRNSATGFYFSQGEGFGWSAPTFLIWHALYSGQTRLVVGANHDYNAASVAQVSPASDAATGFGLASSLVMNSLTNDGFAISFEHTSYSWWKVTLTEIFDSSFWGSNANYAKAEGASYATITTYLANSQMPVDANGAAYLHVVGAGNSGGSVSVTNFTDGTFKTVPEDDATQTDIDAAKAKINAIDPAEFPASLKDDIVTLKTSALTEIASATKPSALQAIVDKTKAAVKKLYADYAHYGDSLTTADSTANFTPCWGAELYAKRFDDRGAFTASINTSYGTRGQMIRQYDAANFSATVNLGAVAVNTVFYFNFDTESQSFPTSGTKYFHIEFLKVDEAKYLAIFGDNGKAHNVSYAAWGTEASGDYTGRLISTFSGTLNFAMATDFTTNKSTFSVNGVSLEFDSSVINKGTAPTSKLTSYVALGGMNASAFQPVLVEKFEDADAKTYADNLTATVAAVKKGIADTKANLLATVPEAGLDDASYGTYKTAFTAAQDALTGANQLTSYDYAYFDIKTLADAAVAEAKAPLEAYEGKLSTAKDEAKAKINAYDEANYRTEQKATLKTTKDTYLVAIDGCATMKAVSETLADALAKLDQIPTDAQLTLQEAKTAAKTEIGHYVDLDNYRSAEQTQIRNIIAQGNTDIDACTTVDAINAKVAAVKALLDAVKTDSQLTLEEAKTNAKAEIAAYKNPSDYRAAEKTKIAEIIAKANTDIDACTDVDDIAAKVTAAKAQLDALKTNAQLIAEELAKAKDSAIKEIDAYISDLSKYSSANQTKIADIISACKDKINAATTVDAVNVALADGKTQLDAVPTGSSKSGGCGGAIAGASVLVSVLALAGAVLVIRKKHEGSND